jgi:hypothetical protein
MTDAGMITFTLRRLGASADLLGPFERVQRKMLKAVLDVFGGTDGADADNAQLRVSAILFIRRLAVAVPESLDPCLRGAPLGPYPAMKCQILPLPISRYRFKFQSNLVWISIKSMSNFCFQF